MNILPIVLSRTLWLRNSWFCLFVALLTLSSPITLAESVISTSATTAKQFADILAADNSEQQAAFIAKGYAVNAANKAAQEWMNQFGTVQVQLNVDNKGNLDNSALDMLVPLYNSDSLLAFTQFGLRNKDSRNTINIGAGLRTIQNNWLYGINSFFDNDVTGKNRRIGVGAEAWTDYFKLSSNGYFAVTNWHQSRDFVDYNERPANGFDVRAEAYLPVYPQLGGKLMYEQYRGDEVALFGKDNRQSNPYAVTVGLSHTPIPLLSWGIEHKQGKQSADDTQINAKLTYRLGESLSQQIDPDAVASLRSLAGSRLDLVGRNNYIVLDYQQQQQPLILLLPQQLTAEELTVLTVSAQITSQYGLDRIEWDYATLTAVGATISQITPQTLSITLPVYQLTRVNSYLLSAVAYDSRGNASSPAITQVVVIQGPQLPAQPFSSITTHINSYSFPIDGNFPTTGFAQATFTLNTEGSPSNYTWSSSDTHVTVSDAGVVTMTGRPSGEVTITAKPNGGGAPLAYTFSITHWFINNGSNELDWPDSNAYCQGQGASLADETELSLYYGGRHRQIGALYSEWGKLVNYPGSGFVDYFYWAANNERPSIYRIVDLSYGSYEVALDSEPIPVVCRR